MVRWDVDTNEVEGIIRAQTRVAQAQIRSDIEKLESRGLKASHPLIDHFKGDVRYLRSWISGAGWFRLFYFRDGEASFKAFYAFMKKGKRIPRNEVGNIGSAYHRVTGKKLR